MVDPPTETQRGIGRPAQLELLGAFERFGVTIGGALKDDDAVTALERFAREIRRFERRAQVELHGAVEAQQLFDRGRGDLRMGLPIRQLLGMGEQGE